MGDKFLPITKDGEFPYYNVFPSYIAHVKPGNEKI